MPPSLHSSQIIGEAKRVLESAGFTEVCQVDVISERERQGVESHDDKPHRIDFRLSKEVIVFEDERSIVGVVTFATWAELESSWQQVQAEMVARISKHMLRTDPKSWDGYLVLITLDSTAPARAVAQVRCNTHRLRKLVATGQELTAISAIEGILLPVLPFTMAPTGAARATLIERLPEMLESKGVDHSLTAAAIASSRENRSPMEGIWSWRKIQ